MRNWPPWANRQHRAAGWPRYKSHGQSARRLRTAFFSRRSGQCVAHVGAKRRPSAGEHGGRIDPNLGIVGREPLQPCSFQHRIRSVRWLKKFRFSGLSVWARILPTTSRSRAGVRAEQGNDPRPPALQTATGMAGLVCKPIGAWMSGCSIFKRSSKRLFGQDLTAGSPSCARASFANLAAPSDKATPPTAADFISLRRSIPPMSPLPCRVDRMLDPARRHCRIIPEAVKFTQNVFHAFNEAGSRSHVVEIH
jgi:hypothetical protein